MTAYANSGLASALMSIGQYLPQSLRQNRLDQQADADRFRTQQNEDEDRKLRNMLNELAIKSKQGELDKSGYETAQRNKGDTDLSAFYEASRVQPVINEMKQGKELSTTPTPYRLDYLQSQPENTNLGLASKYQLPRDAAYNKGAENVVEQLNKEEKNRIDETKASGKGGGANVWSQKDYKYKNNPDALPALKQQLKDFNVKGLLDDDMFEMLDRLSNTDPANAEMLFNKTISAPKIAAATINAQTDPKVHQEYSLIPPKAAGAAASNTATGSTDVSLRSEFLNAPEIKSLQSLYANYDKTKGAYSKYLKGESKPYEVDQQLGYFASKALDPNSVVMPGEFDRFAKGLGFDKPEAMVQSLINGGLKLTNDQRKAMYNIVENSWNTARQQGQSTYQYYNELADDAGHNKKKVTGKLDYIFNPQKGVKTTPEQPTQPTKASSYLDEIRARRKALGK